MKAAVVQLCAIVFKFQISNRLDKTMASNPGAHCSEIEFASRPRYVRKLSLRRTWNYDNR